MKKITSTLGVFLVILCMTAMGQDTELYVGSNQNGRPKVLIILDNSGSMSTLVSSGYDSSITYSQQNGIQSDRLYWSNDFYGKPPNQDTIQYVNKSSNRCASSVAPLDTDGTYTDYLRAWRQSSSGTLNWEELNNNSQTQSSAHIDCYRDVNEPNSSNPGIADGFPENTSGPYATTVNSSIINSNGERNLFTANFMNWYYDPSRPAEKKRIEIAKEVLTNIINSNPNVDFGLEVFNYNATASVTDGPPHGGRIVSKINKNMTGTQRANLITLVDGITAYTSTPLCESLYEAYRYFAGLNVYYGNDEAGALPSQDTSAEYNGKYISPIENCQEAYVILMTDGKPQFDIHANNLIDSLPGIGSVQDNRLDELAGWLYNNDLDNDSSNGMQRVVTYTIGFQTDQVLLQSAASKGGGEYYVANNAVKLQQSFQAALNQIIQTNTSFTAPAVAVSSFNRSRSMDDIYMSMFRPNSGSRWPGNLKKLKINSSGVLVDADNQPAIDPANGHIRDTAQTFWGTTTDGGKVLSGGAGELLAARTSSSRVIKTNTGALGALEYFDTSNSNLSNSDLDAASTAEKNNLIKWARGIDVDDEDADSNITETRSWILGDPLHSRPLVINYGARGSYTKSAPDIRVLMGTNHGVLHMFGGDDGQENWAFMPKKLLFLTKLMRENNATVNHPYGIDGSVVSHIIDHNKNGTIDSDDKVYIYFGLRRGGSAYYAMDISDPDNPKYMWRLDKTSSGFSELGQSWSKPIITKIPGVSDPVMIISGGYDTNKDLSSIGTNDSVGRGIFIVKATTGDLIWSITPAANSAKNLQETGMLDSIPATIAMIDSNGDRLTDRLYVGDTGGNVWRVDMPGNTLPTADQDTWSVFKIASLGGTAANTDRRFFSQIDIVGTRDKNGLFDALLFGSGNRAHPKETAVDNSFYMIRDKNIDAVYHGSTGRTIPAVIKHNDLYDATSNVLQGGSATLPTLLTNGWRISLEADGEKNLSSSVTLDGTVFFTTFSPETSTSTCVATPGTGNLYAVNLHYATAVYNWDTADSDLTKEDRKKEGICDCLPETPPPHFDDGGNIRIIVNEGTDNGTFETGSQLKTDGTYWYN